MFALVHSRSLIGMVQDMAPASARMVSGRRAVLTDAKIKAAKARDKAYRLSDTGQLYLQVSPAGGRHWRMNYTFGRSAKDPT